jgi:hypothetical protein
MVGGAYRVVFVGSIFPSRQDAPMDIRHHRAGICDRRLGIRYRHLGNPNHRLDIRNHHMSIGDHDVGIDCQLGLKWSC